MGWQHYTDKVTWHINQVVTWQIENDISPLSQNLWIPNLAGFLHIMNGPQKVTWHFNSVVTWQFENIIFPQPQVLWLPNLAGYVLRLRGRLAHSQMTLLFRGHITKTSFSLLSSLSHCLSSVELAKDERTSFKKFTIHVTLPPLNKLKKLCLFFLVPSKWNCFFTSLICIPTVHKTIYL